MVGIRAPKHCANRNKPNLFVSQYHQHTPKEQQLIKHESARRAQYSIYEESQIIDGRATQH